MFGGMPRIMRPEAGYDLYRTWSLGLFQCQPPLTTSRVSGRSPLYFLTLLIYMTDTAGIILIW